MQPDKRAYTNLIESPHDSPLQHKSEFPFRVFPCDSVATLRSAGFKSHGHTRKDTQACRSGESSAWEYDGRKSMR